MNRRQTEKHFKRKWRQSFAEMFKQGGVMVKPSRIKLTTSDIYPPGNEPRMIAKAAGYEVILSFKVKEEAKDEQSNTV